MKEWDTIGNCVSNPVSARRVAKALSVSQTTLQTPQLLKNKSVAPSELSNKKMKGLFKSKPRTPPEIVRQTRDLLLYTHRASSDLRESKREEKVNPSLPCFFYPNSDPSMFSFFFFFFCFNQLSTLCGRENCRNGNGKSLFNFCCYVISFAEIKLNSENLAQWLGFWL